MNDDENQPVNKITKITANNGSSVKVTVISVMFSFLCVPTKHCAWLYLFSLAYFLLRHVSTDNDHIHGWPTSNCRVNNKFGQSAVVSWMTVEDIFATQTYFLVVWSICRGRCGIQIQYSRMSPKTQQLNKYAIPWPWAGS